MFLFPGNRLHSETLPGKYGTGRKKKAPLPPASEQRAAARVERSQSDLVRKPRSADSTEESSASKSAKPFLSYKVKVGNSIMLLLLLLSKYFKSDFKSQSMHFQYFGKRVVKDFRGNDSTKAAIEASKKLKGTTRYLLLTERSIKILKSDGKVGENLLIDARK